MNQKYEPYSMGIQKGSPAKNIRNMNFTQTLCHVTLGIGKLPSDSEKVIPYEWGMAT